MTWWHIINQFAYVRVGGGGILEHLFSVVSTHPVRSGRRSTLWVPFVRKWCRLLGLWRKAFSAMVPSLRKLFLPEIRLALALLAFCEVLKPGIAIEPGALIEWVSPFHGQFECSWQLFLYYALKLWTMFTMLLDF